MAQWVALWPVFDVYTREKGYEGGGLRGGAWWYQEASETHLRTTLDEILLKYMRRRQDEKNMHYGPGVTSVIDDWVVGDSGMETGDTEVSG